MQKARFQKNLLLALKIAVGSSVAIYIAELLKLDFASSAGSIALLTLVTTKWGTVKLSVARILTFGFTVLIAALRAARIRYMFIRVSLQRIFAGYKKKTPNARS